MKLDQLLDDIFELCSRYITQPRACDQLRKSFLRLRSRLVGCAGLVLFGDTDLAAQAERGEFDPLDERGLLEN